MASLKETEDILMDDFKKALENAKEYQFLDYSCSIFGTENLQKQLLLHAEVKSNILTENLKQQFPCSNTLVVAEKLKNFLMDQNKQISEEVIPMLQEEKDKLQLSLEKTSIRLSKQQFIAKKIDEALTEKQASLTSNLDVPVVNHVEHFMTQANDFKESRKLLLKRMKEYIDKNMPKDPEFQTNQPHILQSLGAHRQIEFTDVNHFIKVLISKSEESGQNLYININNYNLYPPHLELLLRNNIVCRHNTQENLIRLCYTGN